MEELLRQYREYLQTKGYKASGIEKIQRSLRQYVSYAREAHLDMYRLTIRQAEHYREQLCAQGAKGEPYSHATVNGKLSALRRYYRYLYEKGVVPTNSFAYVRDLKKSDALPKGILTQTQMASLLESLPCSTRRECMEKIAIELLYATGMRIGEAASLAVADVDVSRSVLLIRDDKTGRDRMCVVSEYANELVKLLLGPAKRRGDTLFAALARGRALRAVINQALARHTQTLGLPHISCHGIRHSIATHLLENGADIRQVQEFLGHRHIRETERYTRVNMQTLRELIRTRHPRAVSANETHD